jgi:type I restriction enzyme S subunit
MNSLETVQLNLVLKEGWQRWKLSHAFNLIGSGTTPPTGSVEYFQKEIPWVNTGDLNDGYIYSVNKFVSEKAVSDFSALKVFPTDSLIIALYGATIGKLGILKIDACTNQACCILSEPNHLDTKFVFYWLMSERNNIIELAQGGGQPNISQEIVKNLRVFAPDIETQKLIATFLDRKTAAIDTLIAKKQRLIQLLEEKCKVLINQAVTKGSNPNVPMKDSGIPWIGKIPEHWEVKRLKYLTTKIIDGTHFTPTYIDSGIPFLRVTDIHHNHIDWSTVKFISEIEHFELSKRCKVEKNDVLLSKNGTIGITFVVNFDRPVSIFVSLCLLKLRKNILLPKFFASLFQTYAIEEQIAEGSKKNTVTNLHLNKICEFWIPVPPIDEQQIILDEINKAGQQIKKLIGSIELQIEKLQEYRRSLITAAVTGKLNIKEVETNV